MLTVKSKRIIIVISVLILLVIIAFFLYNFSVFKKNTEVIGNKEVLVEINNLLPGVYYQNLSENNFIRLKTLVVADKYASDETNELILLAKYKEYTHIGHSLGFLFEYINTGKKAICPGHSLSHYYVFLKHGENKVADENLQYATSNVNIWQSSLEEKNQSYLLDVNYTYYRNLINYSINKISIGNNNQSDENVSLLAEAPCI